MMMRKITIRTKKKLIKHEGFIAQLCNDNVHCAFNFFIVFFFWFANGIATFLSVQTAKLATDFNYKMCGVDAFQVKCMSFLHKEQRIAQIIVVIIK